MGKMMREWEAEQRAAREKARGEREAQEAARKPAPDYDPGLWGASTREHDDHVDAPYPAPYLAPPAPPTPPTTSPTPPAGDPSCDYLAICPAGHMWKVVRHDEKCPVCRRGGAP